MLQITAPTRALARFVTRARYADLPAAVTAMARQCLLDWLGICLAGSQQPLASVLERVIAQLGGHPQATVIGSGTKTSSAHAALINGTLAHSIDFDDVHLPSRLHASAPVWAAALAVAEWQGASGEAATTAFVVGYEVMARIGLAVGVPMIEAFFHPTGTLGYYGAAAAAGYLLGLDEEAVARSFGIAASQAGGLIQVRGTMCKPFFAGHAAHGGVLAAVMARNGFESTTDAIEGAEGVIAAYGRSGTADQAFSGLGERYEILNNSFKIYASCALTHAMLDGLLAIRRAAAFDPEQIAEITVGMYPYAATTYVNRPDVRTGLAGKFSGQYCAAIGLLDGQVQEAQFTDARVADPAVTTLMRRVRLVPIEGMGPDQADVTIRLTDGQVFHKRVDAVIGSPANPVSWDQLADKFTRLALGPMDQTRVDQLLDRLERWPAVDVRDLLTLTVRPS